MRFLRALNFSFGWLPRPRFRTLAIAVKVTQKLIGGHVFGFIINLLLNITFHGYAIKLFFVIILYHNPTTP